MEKKTGDIVFEGVPPMATHMEREFPAEKKQVRFHSTSKGTKSFGESSSSVISGLPLPQISLDKAKLPQTPRQKCNWGLIGCFIVLALVGVALLLAGLHTYNEWSSGYLACECRIGSYDAIRSACGGSFIDPWRYMPADDYTPTAPPSDVDAECWMPLIDCKLECPGLNYLPYHPPTYKYACNHAPVESLNDVVVSCGPEAIINPTILFNPCSWSDETIPFFENLNLTYVVNGEHMDCPLIEDKRPMFIPRHHAGPFGAMIAAGFVLSCGALVGGLMLWCHNLRRARRVASATFKKSVSEGVEMRKNVRQDYVVVPPPDNADDDVFDLHDGGDELLRDHSEVHHSTEVHLTDDDEHDLGQP